MATQKELEHAQERLCALKPEGRSAEDNEMFDLLVWLGMTIVKDINRIATALESQNERKES